MDMTETALLEALRNAQPKPGSQYPDAFTTSEIAEMTGWAMTRTQHTVRALCRAGQMEGMRDWRETSVGHMQRYPVFRLVKEAA